MEPLGHVDFYPGQSPNYGHDQPGCLEVINIISCSHSRAREIYGASFKDAICLASGKCEGDPKNIPNSCSDAVDSTGTLEAVSMGYW